MSIAELEALWTAANAALEAEDYDTAISKALAIQLRLAATPNISRSLGGGGNQSIAWTPQAIGEFIATCRALKSVSMAASGPLQQTPVTYERSEITDDY